MKKYKIKKNPIKKEEINLESPDPASQVYKEKDIEKKFIYDISPQIDNIVNSINSKKNEILNQTLNIENKPIDIFKNESKEKQVDILSTEKKLKKKKIKKKKKSIKKVINLEKEEEKKIEENTVNEIEVETPKGKEENDKYYLIEYKTKNQKENNEINQRNAIMNEENYNTFHNDELEETIAEENLPEETTKTNETEKIKKSNIYLSSNANNKLSKNHFHTNSYSVDNNIDPEKQCFKDLKSTENNIEIKQDKMRRIKFIKKEDNNPKPIMDDYSEDNLEEKEKKLKSDTNDVKSLLEKERENNINYNEEKQKEHKNKSIHKKKKKISTKRKFLIHSDKIILIQSIWRRYIMRKLIFIIKKLQNLNIMYDLLLKKRLKSNLLFFFRAN